MNQIFYPNEHERTSKRYFICNCTDRKQKRKNEGRSPNHSSRMDREAFREIGKYLFILQKDNGICPVVKRGYSWKKKLLLPAIKLFFVRQMKITH